LQQNFTLTTKKDPRFFAFEEFSKRYITRQEKGFVAECFPIEKH
jgi:hypothetical protein